MTAPEPDTPGPAQRMTTARRAEIDKWVATDAQDYWMAVELRDELRAVEDENTALRERLAVAERALFGGHTEITLKHGFEPCPECDGIRAMFAAIRKEPA